MRDAIAMEDIIFGDDSDSETDVAFIAPSENPRQQKTLRERYKRDMERDEENKRIAYEMREMRKALKQVQIQQQRPYPRNTYNRGNFHSQNRARRDRRENAQDQSPMRQPQQAPQQTRPPLCKNCPPDTPPHWPNECRALCSWCGIRNSHAEIECRKKKAELRIGQYPVTHPNNIQPNTHHSEHRPWERDRRRAPPRPPRRWDHRAPAGPPQRSTSSAPPRRSAPRGSRDRPSRSPRREDRRWRSPSPRRRRRYDEHRHDEYSDGDSDSYESDKNRVLHSGNPRARRQPSNINRAPRPHPERLALMTEHTESNTKHESVPNEHSSDKNDDEEAAVSYYAGKNNDYGLPLISVGFCKTDADFKHKTDALLDCGSTLSLISQSLYSVLFRDDAAGPLRAQTRTIKHAEGGSMSIAGVSTIRFTLIGKNEQNQPDTSEISYDFMVLNQLAHPFILGHDFHRHCAVRTDSGSQQIYFPHYDILCDFKRFSRPLKNQPEKTTLFVSETTTLKARTVTQVTIEHGPNDPWADSNRTGVVFGLQRDLRKGNLYIPQAVVTLKNGKSSIVIANFSTENVKILAERPIATFMPVWRANAGDSTILFTIDFDIPAPAEPDRLHEYILSAPSDTDAQCFTLPLAKTSTGPDQNQMTTQQNTQRTHETPARGPTKVAAADSIDFSAPTFEPANFLRPPGSPDPINKRSNFDESDWDSDLGSDLEIPHLLRDSEIDELFDDADLGSDVDDDADTDAEIDIEPSNAHETEQKQTRPPTENPHGIPAEKSAAQADTVIRSKYDQSAQTKLKSMVEQHIDTAKIDISAIASSTTCTPIRSKQDVLEHSSKLYGDAQPPPNLPKIETLLQEIPKQRTFAAQSANNNETAQNVPFKSQRIAPMKKKTLRGKQKRAQKRALAEIRAMRTNPQP